MDNLNSSIDKANERLKAIKSPIDDNIHVFKPVEINTKLISDYCNSAEFKRKYPLASVNNEVWTAFVLAENSYIEEQCEWTDKYGCDYVWSTDIEDCMVKEKPIYVLRDCPHDSGNMDAILLYVISHFIKGTEPLEPLLTIRGGKIISTNFRHSQEVSNVLDQINNDVATTEVLVKLVNNYFFMAEKLQKWIISFDKNLLNDFITFLDNAEIQLQAEQERGINK